jgi:hypothetical protein
MELAFLTPLLKDGAKSVSGGVAINNEGLFKMWLSKNRSGANGVDESVKHGFMFVIPVESAAFSAVGYECIERGGEHAKVANIHPVEVEKTEESM